MQNKPNFRKAEMKLSFYLKNGYENQGRLRNSKNKPNQTQFQNGYTNFSLSILPIFAILTPRF